MANTDALKQLQQQSADKLQQLAKELIKFTPVQTKYLNVDAMVKNVFDSLNNLYFNNNIDWDELAEIECDNVGEFCYDMYRNIIIGVKDTEYGYNGKTFPGSPYTGESQYRDIEKLVIANYIDMIKDYKLIINKTILP